ncbi:MAG: glycosyltransferase [Verrucomicrobia bacterium]|nr:glycosyltransferase [Verrucomicrobiota bacterium]
MRGKFLFSGENKFFIQGVTYGPFREGDDHLGAPEKARRDFALVAAAGFNVLRVYHPPPRWFLDLAAEHGLRVMVTVPWQRRVLFLDDGTVRREIRASVRRAAKAGSGHPAVLGYYIDNEIPPDLVRWYGPQRVEGFLDSLVRIVKDEDSCALAAYANFPPTEYLLPKETDFLSYNVYLHRGPDLRAYLSRLQNLAEGRPLVLGEFGMDTIRHSQEEQAALLDLHWDEVFRGGLAGTILFSWTDEWFTDGIDVEDWAFGLVQRDRQPKLAYRNLAQKTLGARDRLFEKFPLPRVPKVSVVVCSYNGAATLRGCLEALQKVDYPDFEVILVDDGSKDSTQSIVADFPLVKNILQPNRGLSAARNVGLQAAAGEIVAYTDSDCMPDSDWLYFLVSSLLHSSYAAVGGPNLNPPAQGPVPAAVAACPGAPTHVLLSDTEAEHIPGCNMAYWRSVLEEIGGFDPEFRTAGDDVDLCWRLMQAGHKIGFSPSALVWHHRRFTMQAYFRQQKGYGEAEAMLRFKHMQYFDPQGSARWKGVIYGLPRFERVFHRPIIYHGIFGTGLFQCLYPKPASPWAQLVSGFEWNALTLFVFLVSIQVEQLRILPLLMLAATLLPAISFMVVARVEPRHDTVLARLTVFYLALTQPLVRDWARYFTWLKGKRTPDAVVQTPERDAGPSLPLFRSRLLSFWSEQGRERVHLLAEIEKILEEEGWRYAQDTGWNSWDVQIFANRWWHIRLRSLTEIYPHGRRLTRVHQGIVPTTFSVLFAVTAVTADVLVALAYPAALPFFLGILALAGTGWLWTGWQLRRRVGDLVRVAARRAQLLPTGVKVQSA